NDLLHQIILFLSFCFLTYFSSFLKGVFRGDLQYIMGHSNITMTLNYYAHATFNSAKAEMERLAAA
ncbi:hypothetical protein, partial [Treponema denticola]|uniref:hypothetical protein n=1 Tax=Treponema denticola TaxID=158 RepID=UPI001C06D1BF